MSKPLPQGVTVIQLGPEKGHVEEVQVTKPPEGALLWIAYKVHDPEEATGFLTELGWHPMAVEDALSDQERPTMREYGEDLFLSLFAVRLDDKHLTFSEVAFFVAPSVLVTVYRDDCPCVDELWDRASKSQQFEETSTSKLLYNLVDKIVDDFFPVLDKLEDQVDDLANTVFKGDAGRITDIMRLRRKLLHLRQNASPARDVLNALLRHDVPIIEPEMRPYFQDVYDHALRIMEWTEANRDTLATVMDLHLSTVSNQVNVSVRRMTVISTVLMTMALVAGVYGMNFERMPELTWPWGYPFALGLMVVLGGGVLYVFRRLGWF